MPNVFDAVIKATDAASGPIRSLVKGMREIITAARGVAESSAHGAKEAAHAGAEAGRSVRHAAEGVKHAGKEAEAAIHGVEKAEEHAEASHIRYFRALGAHVRLLKGHFGELNASIGEVGNSLKEFLPALGALAAGGSLVGMFEMTHEAGEAAIAFDAMAQKVGLTASQYAGFAWAAKESGVTSETMNTSLERLNRTMAEAIAGKSSAKDAAKLFAHLGIKLKDAQGHTRSMTDIMPQLAEAFQKTHDPTMRALMAFTLFGKQGQELLPVLMQGGEKLEEMAKAGADFADFGSPEQREKLKAFGHAWGEMDAAAEGFKTRLSTELAPALQPIVEMARDWIMANRDWIATAMADRVSALKDVIKSLIDTVKDIHDGTKSWTGALRDAAMAHLGLTALIGGVVLVLGSPFLMAAASAGTALLMFGRVLMGLQAILWANPILAAIGAVALTAYLLYENWDLVKTKIGKIWDWFSHSVWAQVVVDSIRPFTILPELIIQNWEPIKAFFTDLWNSVTAVFNAAWSKISPIVDSPKSAGEWVRGSWIGRQLGSAAAPTADAARAAAPRVQSPSNMRTYDDDGTGGLYRPNGPAAQTLQQDGKVKVQIDVTGAQPGTKVTSEASGIAQPPDTNVGYAAAMGYGY